MESEQITVMITGVVLLYFDVKKKIVYIDCVAKNRNMIKQLKR